MIEIALVVATAVATVGLLAAVVWLLRGRLIQVVLEAVRAERERQRATSTGRPRELLKEVMYSGSRTYQPERDAEVERAEAEAERAAKLEAGRAIARERGWTS